MLPLFSGHCGTVAVVDALDVKVDCGEDDEDDEAVIEVQSVEAGVCDDEVQIAGEDSFSAIEDDGDIGLSVESDISDMKPLTEVPEEDVYDVIVVEGRVVVGESLPEVIEDKDVCVVYVQFVREDVAVLDPQEIWEETEYEGFKGVKGEVCDECIDVDVIETWGDIVVDVTEGTDALSFQITEDAEADDGLGFKEVDDTAVAVTILDVVEVVE